LSSVDSFRLVNRSSTGLSKSSTGSSQQSDEFVTPSPSKPETFYSSTRIPTIALTTKEADRRTRTTTTYRTGQLCHTL